MVVSNQDKIIEALKRYTENSMPEYAVMLTGVWGCGKTWFVQNILKDRISPQILYISLFGVNSVEEVKCDIVGQVLTYSLDEVANAKAEQITGEELHTPKILNVNVGACFSKTICGLASLLGNDRAFKITSNLSALAGRCTDFDKYLIVIDDMERTELTPVQLLGIVDFLVHQNKAHVLLVCNEKEVDKEKYLTTKEKVIGLTLQYSSDFLQSLQYILETDKFQDIRDLVLQHSELLVETFKDCDSSNLRTLQAVLMCFSELYNELLHNNIIAKTEEYDNFNYNLLASIAVQVIYLKEKAGTINFGDDIETELLIKDGKFYTPDSHELTKITDRPMSLPVFKFVYDYILTYHLDVDLAKKTVQIFIERKVQNIVEVSKLIEEMQQVSQKEAEDKLQVLIDKVKSDYFNVNIYPNIIGGLFLATEIVGKPESKETLKILVRNNVLRNLKRVKHSAWLGGWKEADDVEEFKHEMRELTENFIQNELKNDLQQLFAGINLVDRTYTEHFLDVFLTKLSDISTNLTKHYCKSGRFLSYINDKLLREVILAMNDRQLHEFKKIIFYVYRLGGDVCFAKDCEFLHNLAKWLTNENFDGLESVRVWKLRDFGQELLKNVSDTRKFLTRNPKFAKV